MYDPSLKDGMSFVAHCAHPQVCVILIHNGVPKLHFHVLIYMGQTIDLYNHNSIDLFRLLNPLLKQNPPTQSDTLTYGNRNHYTQDK